LLKVPVELTGQDQLCCLLSFQYEEESYYEGKEQQGAAGVESIVPVRGETAEELSRLYDLIAGSQ